MGNSTTNSIKMENTTMPELPDSLHPGGKAPSKEEQKQQLINEISSISTQMDVIWEFHPNNPKSKNMLEQYKLLEEWRANSMEEYKKLMGS